MLLDEIGTYLQTKGVGTLAVSLFKGMMPDQPDTATSIMEYGGIESIRRMSATPGNPAMERPAFQVMCRSTDYLTARNKAELAYKSLDGFGGVLSNVQYWITANQPPFFIQRDANSRVWIGFNCLATKTLSTS